MKNINKISIAIDICNGKQIDNYQNFYKIYPFSTENLAGWMPMLNFRDKTFLTVGSSSDQIINAVLLGSKEQTIIDINPFIKEYFYLKKSCLTTLSRNEYLEFLCSYNYNRATNENVFNLKTFEKIIPSLIMFDYNSYLFWSKIFNDFSGNHIKKHLFFSDDERCSPILQKMNLYLHDSDSYVKAQEEMRKLKINFIESNIYQDVNLGSFDNINISNIGQYVTNQEELLRFQTLVKKLSSTLNVDGSMLVMYLFGTITNNSYFKGQFNLIIKENLKDYISEFYTFPSVKEYVLGDSSAPDSAIIYKKK